MSFKIEFSGFNQGVFLGHKPFDLKLYEGWQTLPEGFNVCKISLDLGERSLLKWEREIEWATAAVEKGLYILWELDFELSHGPIGDEALFLTFQLNIEHFNQTVWALFEENTFAVSLYRGGCRFEIEDLRSLAALLPQEATCALFLDTSDLQSPADYFYSLSQEKLAPFYPFLKGPLPERYPYAFPFFGWGKSHSPLGYASTVYQELSPSKSIPLALLLPDPFDSKAINEVIEVLGEKPFRAIPESLFIYDWEGVEKLMVPNQNISAKARRMLAGFEAAGGSVCFKNSFS